jgi:hypothetical protein
MNEVSLITVGVAFLLFLTTSTYRSKIFSLGTFVLLSGVILVTQNDIAKFIIDQVDPLTLSCLVVVTLASVLAVSKSRPALVGFILFFLLPATLYFLVTDSIFFRTAFNISLLIVTYLASISFREEYSRSVYGAAISSVLHAVFFFISTNSKSVDGFSVLIDEFFYVSVGFFVIYVCFLGGLFYESTKSDKQRVMSKLFIFPLLWTTALWHGQALWFELNPGVAERLFTLLSGSILVVMTIFFIRVIKSGDLTDYVQAAFGFFLLRSLYFVLYDQSYLQPSSYYVMIVSLSVSFILLNENNIKHAKTKLDSTMKLIVLLNYIGVPFSLGFFGHQVFFITVTREPMGILPLVVLLQTVAVSCRGFNYLSLRGFSSDKLVSSQARESLPPQIFIIVCVIISSYFV